MAIFVKQDAKMIKLKKSDKLSYEVPIRARDASSSVLEDVASDIYPGEFSLLYASEWNYIYFFSDETAAVAFKLKYC